MNVMQASTCPLLWWLYDDDTACLMLNLLQKHLNFSVMKLVPESDTIFYGNKHLAKIILQLLLRYSAAGPSTHLTVGMLL